MPSTVYMITDQGLKNKGSPDEKFFVISELYEPRPACVEADMEFNLFIGRYLRSDREDIDEAGKKSQRLF